MRPDDRELDDEIRGHLELEIQERIERGEDPGTARRNALGALGYQPQLREEMRRVWYSRWFDTMAALIQDMRVGLRSLLRAKGMSILMVEQNAKRALEISDHGVVIELGRTRMAGAARAILADPRVGQLFLGGALADESTGGRAA